ncbi:hypothetical protein [Acinetobacter gerneri]
MHQNKDILNMHPQNRVLGLASKTFIMVNDRNSGFILPIVFYTL